MNKQATDEFADFEVNPIDDLLTGILIRYNVIPHLTYVVANGYECKLDPWLPKTNFGERVPTLIHRVLVERILHQVFLSPAFRPTTRFRRRCAGPAAGVREFAGNVNDTPFKGDCECSGRFT